jgi:hypothetical protein
MPSRSKRPPGAPGPRFLKGFVVYWDERSAEYLQIAKVRWNEGEERWEYRVRNFNAIFERGDWVPEAELRNAP